MVRYKVTIRYVDYDGSEKRCTIVKWANSKAEARQYALRFFFKPEELSMVKSVEVVGE